jgi:hypothetical protein
MYATGNVVAAGFKVLADTRHRVDSRTMDGAKAAEVIETLRPVLYKHIDTPTVTRYGFDTSTVETNIPAGVGKVEGYVPNIYSPAIAVSPTTLVLERGSTTMLVPKKDMYLYIYDTDNVVREVKVTAVLDTKRLKIDTYLPTKKWFVYGQRVDDMRTLDTDAVLAVSVSAMQHISSVVQGQQATIKRYEAILESQSSALDMLTMRLSKIEHVVAAFSF